MLNVQDEQKGTELGAFLHAALCSLAVPFLILAQTQAQGITQTSGDITRVGDTTHLEFSGLAEWTYEIQKVAPNKYEVLVPGFDQATEVKVGSFSDQHIKSIEIDKSAPDKKYLLKITTTKNDVEVFDYQTDDPQRLILDFYLGQPEPKPEATPVVKTEKKSPQGAKLPAKKVARSEYQKIDRSPAGSELLNVSQSDNAEAKAKAEADRYPKRGLFDGNDPDYDRFQIKDYEIKDTAIIASQQNIYLKFPMLAMPFDRFERLFADKPEYEILPKDTEANKEARFLHALYLEGKFSVFKKVYEYYLNKYPASPYEEILRNLNVEMHIAKYLADRERLDFDTFRSDLRMMDKQYSDSPMRNRNFLLLTYSAVLGRESLEALQLIEEALGRGPDKEEVDQLRIAKTLALMALRKPEDANKTLGELEATGASDARRVEAVYRKGDIQFEFKKYKEAIQDYEMALKKYPKYAKIFPNALYNLAESQFWVNDYRNALKSYLEFLKTFPVHAHDGFAMTRVGEVLDILGADEDQVANAFLESYFRYPKNEGAEIARIRMLSRKFKGMKDKEMKIAVEEIQAIGKKSSLPRVDEFVTLMLAEGYGQRGDYSRSLDDLMSYFQSNPTTVNTKVFRGRILRNISELLRVDIEKSAFLEALNFYGKYSGNWLKNSGRLDVEFFRARAFEMAGVYSDASEIYRSLLNQRQALAGTATEKEKLVYEYLPSADQIRLRLAAVALEQKQYREAFTELSGIKTPLAGEEDIQRAQIGAEVAFRMGDLKAAEGFLQSLIKKWSDKSDLLAKPSLKLAHIYSQQGRLQDMDQVLSGVEKSSAAAVDGDPDVRAESLQLRGEYYLKKGEKLAAVEKWLKLLEEFESQRPLQGLRYQAGLVLFNEGDVKGAEKVWNGLAAEGGGFYSNLAQEKIKQMEWNQTYKRYVDRIPAATELK
jgi:tetratricopeptide (TPR) repeat protein